MDVALMVHDVSRVKLLEAGFQGLNDWRRIRVVLGIPDDPGDGLRVRIDLLDAFDDVGELLPRDVLELDAGHGVHEHRGQP